MSGYAFCSFSNFYACIYTLYTYLYRNFHTHTRLWSDKLVSRIFSQSVARLFILLAEFSREPQCSVVMWSGSVFFPLRSSLQCDVGGLLGFDDKNDQESWCKSPRCFPCVSFHDCHRVLPVSCGPVFGADVKWRSRFFVFLALTSLLERAVLSALHDLGIFVGQR